MGIIAQLFCFSRYVGQGKRGYMLEKIFKLRENNTTVRTELIAGLTTFMTMVYILAVNPSILSASGMDAGSVLTATAVASAIACFCMAAFSNKPFALSAGLGLNAYFAYTICGSMGYSWQAALTAVFVEGVIFIILSLTNVREAIFNAIPRPLKIAVSCWYRFVHYLHRSAECACHCKNDSSTLVALFSFKSALADGTFFSEGITILLMLIGVADPFYLLIKGVKGYMLCGILVTWLLRHYLPAVSVCMSRIRMLVSTLLFRLQLFPHRHPWHRQCSSLTSALLRHTSVISLS